jgi:hypothetical protein
MTESLQDAKARLRKKYIGRNGIHSFGIRPDQNAIIVHFEPEQSAKQRHLLAELQADAEGFEIVEVAEAPPRAAVSH